MTGIAAFLTVVSPVGNQFSNFFSNIMQIVLLHCKLLKQVNVTALLFVTTFTELFQVGSSHSVCLDSSAVRAPSLPVGDPGSTPGQDRGCWRANRWKLSIIIRKKILF